MKSPLTSCKRIRESFRHFCNWQAISLILLCISSFISPGKAQTKQWDKTIGGRSNDNLNVVEQTLDGGYILGGTSNSRIGGDKTVASKGLEDFWIVKRRADGTKAWEKVFGGAGEDALISLQQTRDGGYILGGYSNSDKNGDKSEASNGITDFWLVKLNADGDKIWDKTLGGDESDLLTSLQQTRDGGYILGGWSRSGISGDKSEANKGGKDAFDFPVADYWVVKLKPDGTKEWDKTLGGTGNDELNSLQQTSDDSYILGGTSNSGISGDKTQANKGGFDSETNTPLDDYWVVKLSANGSKVWDKTFGGDSNDFFESVQQTRDGGYILGGHSTTGINGDKTEANRGVTDYWIVKLNATGEKLWDKTIGGDDGDYLQSVHQTSTGGYILGGFSRSNKSNEKSEACRGDYDYWLVKVDAAGKVLADKTIGGNKKDFFTSLDFTSDGGYILGGSSESDSSGEKTEGNRSANSTGGSYDYWIVKVKEVIPPLAAVWDRRYGGMGFENLTSVIKTSDGGYLVGGYTNSGVSGDKTQTSRGRNDYWLVKTDANGQKQWDKRYGSTGDDYLNRIIQTFDGGYLLAGSSLSNSGGDKTQNRRGDRDYWIVKINNTGQKQWDKRYGGTGYDELKKVIQLSSGEYILGGYSNSPAGGDKSQGSRGGTDYWLVKVSSTGALIWDKRYGGNLNESLGSMVQTPGGGLLLGGSSLSGKSWDKSEVSRGGSDFWLISVDKNGQKLWDKTYGGSGEDKAYSLGRSGRSDYFISGYSDSPAGYDKTRGSQGQKDFWFLKINSSGAKIWDKRFGGNFDDEIHASIQTQDGGYLLAGVSFSGKGGNKTQPGQGSSDYWIVKTDADGMYEWDKRFGGSSVEELRAVIQTQEGGFLLAGRALSDISGDVTQPLQGGYDYWLVKVAPEPSPLVAERRAMPVAPLLEEASLKLLQAYPNPFQEQVTIHFTLPETQPATVRVLDSQGREVTTLFQGEAQAHQPYQVQWKATKEAAGMYLLQLHTPIKQSALKILLNK